MAGLKSPPLVFVVAAGELPAQQPGLIRDIFREALGEGIAQAPKVRSKSTIVFKAPDPTSGAVRLGI